jgi:hypothetical protein
VRHSLLVERNATGGHQYVVDVVLLDRETRDAPCGDLIRA